MAIHLDNPWIVSRGMNRYSLSQFIDLQMPMTNRIVPILTEIWWFCKEALSRVGGQWGRLAFTSFSLPSILVSLPHLYTCPYLTSTETSPHTAQKLQCGTSCSKPFMEGTIGLINCSSGDRGNSQISEEETSVSPNMWVEKWRSRALWSCLQVMLGGSRWSWPKPISLPHLSWLSNFRYRDESERSSLYYMGYQACIVC